MPELLLCFLLPLSWAHAPRRIVAGGSVLLLYLVAAREQPLAITRVLPELPTVAGIALWLPPAVSLTLPSP
ncbi:MAG: conjugal transfer protein TraB, partial [Ferrovum sp.]|nr:conjugal transfer protein TraB [Ferrovum sp.]